MLVVCVAEQRAADHEEIRTCQHRQTQILLLFKRRKGEYQITGYALSFTDEVT